MDELYKKLDESLYALNRAITAWEKFPETKANLTNARDIVWEQIVKFQPERAS